MLEKFISIFAKLPVGENLKLTLEADEHLSTKIEQLDLEEIVGNILDNACKWAKGEIEIKAHTKAGYIAIEVCDDGPGVANEDITRIVERGGRLDENKPGSGLGLAIVSDIVGAYGGKLEVRNSSDCGLIVCVEIPA